jgi:hypothetical protein
MSMSRLSALVLIAGLLVASVLDAQAPNIPSARLSKITRLQCAFATMATGTWKEGVAESSTRPAKLSIGFNSVDTQEGIAEAVGDAGKAHITVRLLGRYLHLMQMDPYGALYVTTVMDTETRASKLQAVHSRHEYTPVSLPGLTSRPEQYYGECSIVP